MSKTYALIIAVLILLTSNKMSQKITNLRIEVKDISTSLLITDYEVKDEDYSGGALKKYHDEAGIITLNETLMGQHTYFITKQNPDFRPTKADKYIQDNKKPVVFHMVCYSTQKEKLKQIKKLKNEGNYAKAILAFNELKEADLELYESDLFFDFRELENEIINVRNLMSIPISLAIKDSLFNYLSLSGKSVGNIKEIDQIITACKSENEGILNEKLSGSKTLTPEQISIINKISKF